MAHPIFSACPLEPASGFGETGRLGGFACLDGLDGLDGLGDLEGAPGPRQPCKKIRTAANRMGKSGLGFMGWMVAGCKRANFKTSGFEITSNGSIVQFDADHKIASAHDPLFYL